MTINLQLVKIFVLNLLLGIRGRKRAKVKTLGSSKYLGVVGLVLAVSILFITLPEVAMPLEGTLCLDPYTQNPCADHHCPMDNSQPVHHCPLCCSLSHHFNSEPYQGLVLPLTSNGVAAVVNRTFLNDLLAETIFHPPEIST